MERSLRDRLKNIAQKNKVPLGSIITEFIIERAVARLMKDQILEKHLVFKGGYVALRCYESPRYTVDLDAIAYMRSRDEIALLAKKALADDVADLVWFEFEKEVDLVTQQEYGGIRLQYRAGIGEKTAKTRALAQIIKLDIGVGDPVTPGPKKTSITEKIGSESISWMVYPIETIVAEKLHCLIARG